MDDTARVIVRREQPEDADAVRAVHSAAFASGAGAAPGTGNASGDVVEARLADELRADGALPRLCFVAEAVGAVVGSVVCSRASLDGRPSVGLGPIGVLPAAQGRGVGSALMHAVLGAAEALEEPAVFLLGSPVYYRRFGFVAAALLGVASPDPSWGEHFQGRALASWHPALAGPFAYAAPFGRL
jgi:putative acetyltransferase